MNHIDTNNINYNRLLFKTILLKNSISGWGVCTFLFNRISLVMIYRNILILITF